ncbi:MAG: hypothetical protein AABZ61_09315, partial [Bacteroidota bacterium]
SRRVNRPRRVESSTIGSLRRDSRSRQGRDCATINVKEAGHLARLDFFLLNHNDLVHVEGDD